MLSLASAVSSSSSRSSAGAGVEVEERADPVGDAPGAVEAAEARQGARPEAGGAADEDVVVAGAGEDRGVAGDRPDRHAVGAAAGLDPRRAGVRGDHGHVVVAAAGDDRQLLDPEVEDRVAEARRPGHREPLHQLPRDLQVVGLVVGLLAAEVGARLVAERQLVLAARVGRRLVPAGDERVEGRPARVQARAHVGDDDARAGRGAAGDAGDRDEAAGEGEARDRRAGDGDGEAAGDVGLEDEGRGGPRHPAVELAVPDRELRGGPEADVAVLVEHEVAAGVDDGRVGGDDLAPVVVARCAGGLDRRALDHDREAHRARVGALDRDRRRS